MKRSQMIEILQETVQDHMNCQCCQTDDEMYSKMLKTLEDAGMMPPVTTLLPLNIKDNGWDPE